MTEEQNTAGEPGQAGPPPPVRRRQPTAHSRAAAEGGDDAAADDRTSPFPYADRFNEWVADETAAPDEPEEPAAEAQHTQEELQEYLHCWTLPGGRLTPEQTRALLAWKGTPDAERVGLESSLASTQQQVRAEPLAPNQRRGHVSWLDRLKHVLGR